MSDRPLRRRASEKFRPLQRNFRTEAPALVSPVSGRAARAVARILIGPDLEMFLSRPRPSALRPIPIRPALRVLLVDDDSLVRWALGCTLLQHGCVVVEDKDGKSAIRTVADPATVFDVILLGFPLPEGDGLEVLTTLKQLAPGSSVLLMSADISADDRAEAARRGASAFVPKPFDLDDVWTLIQDGRAADRLNVWRQPWA